MKDVRMLRRSPDWSVRLVIVLLESIPTVVECAGQMYIQSNSDYSYILTPVGLRTDVVLVNDS